MSPKAKIVMIYVGVAVMSAIILSLSMLTVSAAKKRDQNQESRMEQRVAMEWSLAKDQVYTDLRDYESPTVFDQTGREFTFKDLEGKVWMFSQFYAACPQCAKRNLLYLVDLYETFSADPNFRMVCVSIDPERDTQERLQKYAEELGVDSSKWLFVSGDRETLMPYMVEAMKYDPVVERTDAKEAAEKGAYQHNMAVALFDKDLEMVARTDLFHHSVNDPSRFEGEKASLKRFTLLALSE